MKKQPKIYTYDDLWRMREKRSEELIKSKSKTSLKELWEWEKSQKFVKLEDYEKLQRLLRQEKRVEKFEKRLKKLNKT